MSETPETPTPEVPKVISFATRRAIKSAETDSIEETVDAGLVESAEILVRMIREGRIKSFVALAWDPGNDNYIRFTVFPPSEVTVPSLLRTLGAIDLLKDNIKSTIYGDDD